MSSSWQKRRSAFNHNWFKNSYLPALGKFLNLLNDMIEDVEFEHSFVSSVLPGWESHREKAFALPQEFESEMSPKILLNRLPLSRCESHTRLWLSDLVHGLWLSRYPVSQWVDESSASVRNADIAYQQLRKALKICGNTRSSRALNQIREEFMEFRKRCQNLAKAMEKFPSEVKVT